ncbi:glucose-6-phosphate 1-dehydrogenase [Treponema paraluiscuniculi Cuniculi A]|uniref:Glucose-6-phosphate 1-dehydrogenase n=2 Tax=Treponema paraluiscuniculi TaxID=53435 RepID=F7XST4_TREPU|nr:glucose-6-phosphate dehydrogenase [Treponema paraluiscuniculi]AEH40417.1 glucose-6-phosphate 1-dehydrogenase [Treponema paraluiscuniculi Cuniculi A]WKC72345.1 glucose-6-phosphate 1-dehydrogenase [Treponema paraluiscuniculi]
MGKISGSGTVAPHILVIFGASGDLAARKLIPSLWDLFEQELLPRTFGILGAGRTALSTESFRARLAEAVTKHAVRTPHDPARLTEFLQKIHYFSFDPTDSVAFANFATYVRTLDQSLHTEGNFIFYLATPPSLYETIPTQLAMHHLNREQGNFRRVVIEKPFGYNLETAQHLNASLRAHFQENQTYRIDHYLGKETVQNILVTRFANPLFEPTWNRTHIDYVEITASESLGVENRGGYYDQSGALRDMIQNHLLLLLGIIAMEAPAVVSSSRLRDEIVKVFDCLRPMGERDVMQHTVRAQYVAGKIRGVAVPGYLEESGVDPRSCTETFAALKCYIDNWRWMDVPFYLRTGKRLPTRVTEVIVHYRTLPIALFERIERPCAREGNALVIRIQPDEGIQLKIDLKEPGAGFKTIPVSVDFQYSALTYSHLPSAYERLLLDCMNGDNTLYHRDDAVESAWRFIDPILAAWKSNKSPLLTYPAGSWGPKAADDLIKGSALRWHHPSSTLLSDDFACRL